MENICYLKPKVLARSVMSRDLNVDKIKKLWVLDVIIQTGSFKKAALQLKVSPSAVSQALSSLEQSVGKPLLIRDRGTITPTQDALDILDVVRPAFEAFDRLRDLGQPAAPQMTWLNFGTYESIAVDILPGLIHSLREKIPHLRLGLRVSRTANLLTLLRKGELCVALIAEVDGLEKFSIKDVAEDRLGLYVSKKHPIREMGWKAIDKYGIGSLSTPKEGYPRYFTKFMRQLSPAKPFILSDSFETLRAAAAAGSLVAVLPNRVATRSDDLFELTPPSGVSAKDSGRHRISIVSLPSCDPEEAAFLADETRRLLRP